MAKDLASLVVSLELQSAKYQQGFDQATKRLQKFQNETNDTLKNIAGAFAGYLSADAILEFSKNVLESTANLDSFSKSAGITVEALSALQFAAKAGGVGTDQLNESLKKLNVSISDAAGDSTNKAALAFQLLGVNVRDSSGKIKDANAVFNEIADKFASTEDGANKVALAVALFGRAGEALIPTLDKGSAGLKQLADEAAAAGAIIDGPTAAAADAFRQKADLLKTVLIDGIGAQVERNLLPVLNELADEFVGTAKSGENLRQVSDEITAGFKLLINSGLVVKEAFGEVGDAIGGAAAAVNAALHGNFREASKILDDQSAHAKKSAQDTVAQITSVWESGGDQILSPIQVTAKKIKDTLGSLSGAEAFQAALKQLQSFADGLNAEASKLDQGTIAATKYKLAHGELAKALAATGAAGQKLADQAIASATKIETQEVTKQLEGLQSQLKSLGGDTVGAGLDSFNKSVEQLQRNLQDIGGATQANGEKIIASLRAATTTQLDYNKAQADSARVQSDYSIEQQRVNDLADAGLITTIEKNQELFDLRAKFAPQLQQIADAEKALADASGNPALVQQAKQAQAAVLSLKTAIDPMTKAIRQDFEDAFANNFADLITGAKSFKEFVGGFFKDIENDLAKIAAKNFAESIFGGTGSGGGIVSLISSLFGGGAHADGGTIPAGKIGLVGEKGPELVMGGTGGTNVIPNGEWGKGGDTYNITVSTPVAPGGQISRASQTQTAATVARAVQQANRRNA